MQTNICNDVAHETNKDKSDFEFTLESPAEQARRLNAGSDDEMQEFTTQM